MEIAERIYELRQGFNSRQIAAILNLDAAEVVATLRNFADAPTDPVQAALAGAGGGGLQPRGMYIPSESYPALSVVGFSDGKLYYAKEDAEPGEAPGAGATQIVAMRGRTGYERDRVGATPRQFAVVDATTVVFGRQTVFVIQSNTDTSFTVRNLAGPDMQVTGYYGANNTGNDGTWLGEERTVVVGGEELIEWTGMGSSPALIFGYWAGNVNGILEVECPEGIGPPSAKWELLNPVA